MEVCNVFLNYLNTLCKLFYTCTCKIKKKFSFLGLKFGIVKPLQALIINYNLYNSASALGFSFSSEVRPNQ